MGKTVQIKQGEGVSLVIKFKQSGASLSVAGASLAFKVKDDSRTNLIITKSSETTPADWTRTNEVAGLVEVYLSTSDTSKTAGNYLGEAKAAWSGTTNTRKSGDISFIIKEAIT